MAIEWSADCCLVGQAGCILLVFGRLVECIGSFVVDFS